MKERKSTSLDLEWCLDSGRHKDALISAKTAEIKALSGRGALRLRTSAMRAPSAFHS